MNAISLHNIGKCYPLQSGMEKWALRNLSGEIPQGQSIGIIGHNGAGKSTLLKLLSGITFPTEGDAYVRGSFSSLLEVGTGFHPDLTGRENIHLNGSVIGIPAKEIRASEQAIIEFSGVSDYIDEPLRTYSSGMRLRLAFAVLAHLTTDILALDEVLAVGDSQFQVQCMDRIFNMRKDGRTILFVSHNLAAVRQLCERTWILNNGSLIFDGNTEDALIFYSQLNSEKEHRFGRVGFIEKILCKATEHTASIEMSISGLLSNAPLEVGVNIHDRQGNALLHFSSRFIKRTILPVNGEVTFELNFSHGLKPGDYPFHVHLAQNEETLQWSEQVSALEIPPYNPYGFHNPDAMQAACVRDFDIIQR